LTDYRNTLTGLQRDLDAFEDEEHDLHTRTSTLSERIGHFLDDATEDLRDEIVEDILEVEILIKERYPRLAESIRAAVNIINQTI